jgi:glutathione S-transferase
MKLYHAPTSPYVRKVRSVIAEKGLTTLVEEIAAEVYTDPAELLALNPLGKIPALLTDDGMALFDSPVICAYLDAHPAGKGDTLTPASGPERWQVMCAEAFGDGLMDLGLALMSERRKPEGEKSPTLTARQRGQLLRTLDAAPEMIGKLPRAITMGHLAIACALGYLDFRHDDIGWRQNRDELAGWFAEIMKRPSLSETAPE